MQQIVKSGISGKVSPREIQRMRENSPTAKDILENDSFFQELQEEQVFTLNQKGLPVVEPTLPVEEKKPAKQKVTKMPVEDVDAEIDRMNALAKKKLAEQKKAEEEAAKVAVEEEVQEVSPEEALRMQIINILGSADKAPSQQTIESWKKEYGAVYVTALNEKDVFCFTYLRRGQWKKLQEAITNGQKSDMIADADEEMKQKVLQYTILWPRPLSLEFFHNSRAGTIDTLFNVIMANSSFLQLNQAMMLTTQL